MKSVFTSVLLLTSIAFATPYPEVTDEAPAARFGAFTYANQLYVTMISDCNKKAATLQVSNLCDKNRATRNFARTCKVKLNITSTMMFCPQAMIFPPKVFVFDLDKEQIAPEARDLVIQHGGQTIEVKVNR